MAQRSGVGVVVGTPLLQSVAALAAVVGGDLTRVREALRVLSEFFGLSAEEQLSLFLMVCKEEKRDSTDFHQSTEHGNSHFSSNMTEETSTADRKQDASSHNEGTAQAKTFRSVTEQRWESVSEGGSNPSPPQPDASPSPTNNTAFSDSANATNLSSETGEKFSKSDSNSSSSSSTESSSQNSHVQRVITIKRTTITTRTVSRGSTEDNDDEIDNCETLDSPEEMVQDERSTSSKKRESHSTSAQKQATKESNWQKNRTTETKRTETKQTTLNAKEANSMSKNETDVHVAKSTKTENKRKSSEETTNETKDNTVVHEARSTKIENKTKSSEETTNKTKDNTFVQEAKSTKTERGTLSKEEAGSKRQSEINIGNSIHIRTEVDKRTTGRTNDSQTSDDHGKRDTTMQKQHNDEKVRNCDRIFTRITRTSRSRRVAPELNTEQKEQVQNLLNEILRTFKKQMDASQGVDQAVELLLEVARLSRTLAEKVSESACKTAIRLVQIEAIREARALIDCAEKAARIANDKRRELSALEVLHEILHKLGEAEEEDEVIAKSVKIAQELKISSSRTTRESSTEFEAKIAELLYTRARLAFAQGQTKKCLVYLNEIDKLSSEVTSAMAYYMGSLRARALVSRRLYDVAKEHMESAHFAAKASQDSKKVIKSNRQLALILTAEMRKKIHGIASQTELSDEEKQENADALATFLQKMEELIAELQQTDDGSGATEELRMMQIEILLLAGKFDDAMNLLRVSEKDTATEEERRENSGGDPTEAHERTGSSSATSLASAEYIAMLKSYLAQKMVSTGDYDLSHKVLGESISILEQMLNKYEVDDRARDKVAKRLEQIRNQIVSVEEIITMMRRVPEHMKFSVKAFDEMIRPQLTPENEIPVEDVFLSPCAIRRTCSRHVVQYEREQLCCALVRPELVTPELVKGIQELLEGVDQFKSVRNTLALRYVVVSSSCIALLSVYSGMTLRQCVAGIHERRRRDELSKAAFAEATNSLILECARAIQSFHKMDQPHGQINPDSFRIREMEKQGAYLVMLTGLDRVLMDMCGTSAVFPEGDAANTPPDEQIPAYAAPENKTAVPSGRSKLMTNRKPADVWALGAVARFILTEEEAGEGDSSAGVAHERLAEIISDCTHAEPLQRPLISQVFERVARVFTGLDDDDADDDVFIED